MKTLKASNLKIKKKKQQEKQENQFSDSQKFLLEMFVDSSPKSAYKKDNKALKSLEKLYRSNKDVFSTENSPKKMS